MGSRIGKLGNRVLTSSKDLFEQVAEALQSELDSIEGHVRRPKGGRPGQLGRHALIASQIEDEFDSDSQKGISRAACVITQGLA